MIFDYFGILFGVGFYQGCCEEIFDVWWCDIEVIVVCSNVVVKFGGLVMFDNGFGWSECDMLVMLDEFIEVQVLYYMYVIEYFGVQCCMFESNFFVDKFFIFYFVYWNVV